MKGPRMFLEDQSKFQIRQAINEALRICGRTKAELAAKLDMKEDSLEVLLTRKPKNPRRYEEIAEIFGKWGLRMSPLYFREYRLLKAFYGDDDPSLSRVE